MTDDARFLLTRRGLLIGAASSAVALAACAPREGEPDETSDSAAEPTTSEFGGSTDWRRFEGTTLNLLLAEHWWTTPVSEQFAEFEDLTGMTIEANILSEDSYYQQALVSLSAGANTYDAVMVGNLQAGQYMEAGWLTALDPYFRDGDLIDPDWFNLEDFFAPARDAGTSKGELFALPISAEAGVIMYRRSMLEAAGITSFESQNALVEASQALVGTMPRPFAGRGRRGLDIVWTWTNYFLTEGGEFFDGDTPAVNSEAGVRATELYVKQLLGEYGPTGASNMSWLEATGLMNEGGAAIYTDASGLLSVLLDDTQSAHTDDIAVQRWPGSANGSAAAPNYWYWLAGIPEGSANKEAAALFYAWAMSPEIALSVSSRSGSPSARASVWDDSTFLSFYPSDTATEITANLEAVQTERVPYARPTFPQEADALALELVNILTNGKNIQTALDDAVVGMQAAL
ncbi:MAG: ABC transporter substrate-binding protein [Beutenbergiaceae bacterium]